MSLATEAQACQHRARYPRAVPPARPGKNKAGARGPGFIHRGRFSGAAISFGRLLFLAELAGRHLFLHGVMHDALHVVVKPLVEHRLQHVLDALFERR